MQRLMSFGVIGALLTALPALAQERNAGGMASVSSMQDNPDDKTRVMAEKGRTLNPSACSNSSNVGRGNPQGVSAGTGISFSAMCF
jgi:hypothetical protein